MRSKPKKMPDLHTLLTEDLALRSHFLSFPVPVQMTAHRANDELHSSEDVRAYLAKLAKCNPEK